MSNFYGTEIEIWFGFGPVGNTEKKFGLIVSNFWGRFFHVFLGKKDILDPGKKDILDPGKKDILDPH